MSAHIRAQNSKFQTVVILNTLIISYTNGPFRRCGHPASSLENKKNKQTVKAVKAVKTVKAVKAVPTSAIMPSCSCTMIQEVIESRWPTQRESPKLHWMCASWCVELWNKWDFLLWWATSHIRKKWDLRKHKRRCWHLRNALREIQGMEERRIPAIRTERRRMQWERFVRLAVLLAWLLCP